ncbi:MAG: YgfZ/GcvT domain-containing protein [Gemmatimonadota bacterium]
MREAVPRGYAAAVDGVAVFDRVDRCYFRVAGRAPGQMLKGVLTGTIPAPPEALAGGLERGTATYHAVLTPKGKMITDLWCWLAGDEAEEGFVLDVPQTGAEGLAAHLGKVLPPRFARMEDISRDAGAVTVAGAGAAEALARLVGPALDEEDCAAALSRLGEGQYFRVPAPATMAGTSAQPSTATPRRAGADPLLLMRTADVWPPAFSVVGSAGAVSRLGDALLEDGAVSAPADVWRTLRIEAGRPAFGEDMDGTTIPVEAGIHTRAIDYEKGCYTGQEVIVRIRDRGHVNRELRLIELGDVEPPPSGTSLVRADEGDDAKPAGRVTSAVRSPRFGETIALAYVRRGVDGPLRVVTG